MDVMNLNIKFVEEIKKHQCLYVPGFKIQDYAQKNLVNNTWREIGKKFGLSGAECRTKWKNLRSVFVRNLKPRPGRSAFRRKYYLHDYMKFCLPYVKINTSLPLLEKNDDSEDTTAPDDAIARDDVIASDDVVASDDERADDETEEDEQPPYDIECVSVPSSSSHIKDSPHSPPKRPQSPELYLQIRSAPSSSIRRSKRPAKEHRHLKTKAQTTINQDDLNQTLEQNPNKMFLLSLLPDLDSMTDAQVRKFKRKAVQIIGDILDECQPPKKINNMKNLMEPNDGNE